MLHPIEASIIALERSIDFILCNEGAVVFDSGSFEKYVQDPEDIGAELDANLELISDKVPFDTKTLAAIQQKGRKGSLMRKRIRSIVQREYFESLDLKKVRAEFNRLKMNTSEFIKRGELSFSMDKASIVVKVLDESAWRGGFSDTFYTTNAKRKEV